MTFLGPSALHPLWNRVDPRSVNYWIPEMQNESRKRMPFPNWMPVHFYGSLRQMYTSDKDHEIHDAEEAQEYHYHHTDGLKRDQKGSCVTNRQINNILRSIHP